MSYYLELRFIKVKEGDEALRIMSKYKELCTLDNFSQVINKKASTLYTQYLMYSQGMGIIPKFYLAERIADILTRNNFNITFVYYEDYKVVGILKTTGIEEIDKLFSREFCFQNSSDTDYDFEEWNDLIQYFPCMSEIINKWKNKEESYFIPYLDDEDLTQKDYAIERYRKSKCYDEIEKFLSVDKILNDTFPLIFDILPNEDNFTQLKYHILKVVREIARKEGKLECV